MSQRVVVMTRLDGEILTALRQIADEEATNVSQIIRRELKRAPAVAARLQARRQTAPAGDVAA